MFWTYTNSEYVYKEKGWFVYPSEAFRKFWCFMSWELITIVAPSNSWKTTFAMDLMTINSWLGRKCFYINLEFPIETVWQNKRLRFHWKDKIALTNLDPLSIEDRIDMEKYVNQNLNKFEYYNNPNGLPLDELLQVISDKALEWYEMFVIDTFSRIQWNLDQQVARTSQNKSMEALQEIAQRLNIAVVILHHTNRAWTFEWSQKIMDLSNVFIMIEKSILPSGRPSRIYKLQKDKYMEDAELEISYNKWEYELVEDLSEIQPEQNKPF